MNTQNNLVKKPVLVRLKDWYRAGNAFCIWLWFVQGLIFLTISLFVIVSIGWIAQTLGWVLVFNLMATDELVILGLPMALFVSGMFFILARNMLRYVWNKFTKRFNVWRKSHTDRLRVMKGNKQ